MTAQLVTDALVMAIWRPGKPDAPLHHSDRGSQYTSEQLQRLMADLGFVCSMSRSGNVRDNAAMESFFSSFKTERTAHRRYCMLQIMVRIFPISATVDPAIDSRNSQG